MDPIYRKSTNENHQKWNLYAYCENNPLTLVDPNGAEGINAQKGQHIVEVAKEWVGTPYNRDIPGFGGRIATKQEGADCSGSVWKIYGEAEFGYSYKQANKSFVDSIEEGGANFGLFKKVEGQSSPQAGDIGLLDGHMVIFCEEKKADGKTEIFVYSATEHNNFTYSTIEWFSGNVTWYRYEEKEPAK